MIAELQVLPTPSGTEDDTYSNVDAAIEALRAPGLEVEVGALGTTIQGSPDLVWSALRAAHEATLAAGANSVVSVVKIAESASDQGPTIASLTNKHRA